MQHIIAIPLTGVGLHGGYRGDTWFRRRLEVFKAYTFKSLLAQTNQNFLVWFWMRPEEEHNPIVQELRTYLDTTGLNYHFSFQGLLYHDDKFTEFSLKTVLRNFLMMLWDCLRYKQIKNPFEILKYSFQNKNKTLPHRLSKALQELTPRLTLEPEVYLTRIDSDDMFHKEAVELIQKVPPGFKRAVTFKNGYVLNKQTGQLADWVPPTNPPFHTIIFPLSVFVDPIAHLAYYASYRSHEDIPRIFECIELPDEHYCYVINHGNISTYWNTSQMYVVTTNGTNIGTKWNLGVLRKIWLKLQGNKTQFKIHPFIGKEYFSPLKEEILAQFGIE